MRWLGTVPSYTRGAEARGWLAAMGALAPLNLLMVLGVQADELASEEKTAGFVMEDWAASDAPEWAQSPPKGFPQAGMSWGGSSGSSEGRRAPLSTADEETCQRACPGMVMIPQSALSMADPEELQRRRAAESGKVIIMMSKDNIAALGIICSLSILGAIYLWKICTRHSCSCRMCRNLYRTHHLLGSGGYGSVWLVERLVDGKQFVSKKIPVREITEVDEYSLEAKELIKLRHRHIVSYEDDFVHVEYGTLEPRTFQVIIMEYCPEGDLKEKIEVDFNSFTELWVRTIFAQLLQAVQYLHSKNVIHRDLKSQNVFLAEDGHVRLGDFGLCRRTPGQVLGQATMSHAGTDCYMAPECLASSKYGKPADMWSLGCVLLELCSGIFMWELDGILGAMVMKDSHAVHKLVKANVVPAVGVALTALVRRLLAVEPAARPTATTCIRRKLFKRGFYMSRQPFGDSLPPAEDDGDRTPSPHNAQQEAQEAMRKLGITPADPGSGSDDDESDAEDEGDSGTSGDEPEEPASLAMRCKTSDALGRCQRHRRRKVNKRH